MGKLEDLILNQEKIIDLYKRSPDQAVISLVGGGGKTTTIKDMASVLKDQGARVLWTTSTAILKPAGEDYDQIFIGHMPQDYEPRRASITVYGDYTETGKLRAKDLAKLDEIIARKSFDLVLIEADGAKRRPIKAAGSHEPVISDFTRTTIGVIGMDALGEDIDRIAHRPELLKEILGVGDGHKIGYRDIIKLVLDRRGLFKDSEAGKILLLNKVKEDQLDLIERIQKRLEDSDIELLIGPYRSI